MLIYIFIVYCNYLCYWVQFRPLEHNSVLGLKTNEGGLSEIIKQMRL